MRVVREVTLDAGLEDVWGLLTDDAELSTWFGGEVTLDVKAGGGGRFVEGDFVRRAVVEEVADRRLLRFRWWPDGADGDDAEASTVAFTLERDGDATRLTVVEEAPVAAAMSGGRPCALTGADAAWDDRLLGLELRCLTMTRVAALVPVRR